MACANGTWIHIRTIGEGATIAQAMKCNGCSAWWIVFDDGAYTIDQADGSEDAFRQAIAERVAR